MSMEHVAGFPYVTVRFDRNGGPVDLQDTADAQGLVRDEQLTDVLVLVHGWNNNMERAGNLYERLLGAMRPLLDGELAAPLAGRRLGVVGVLWPSMRYTESALIPGGAASSDPSADFGAELAQALEIFDDPESPLRPALMELQANLAVVEDKTSLQRRFLEAVRAQLPLLAAPEDQLSDADLADWATVKERLSVNLEAGPSTQPQAASGLFSGAIQAIRNLLNISTYYEMKARAGLIGQSGLIGLLKVMQRVQPGLRVHLIGHSFGGRLVSAAARGPDGEPPLPVDSLHLLQAAFSHYGFGAAHDPAPEGYFRSVMTQGRVRGPVLVTHTKHDVAVGVAYVLASVLAGQSAASLGGPDDLFGAIGSNGALNTGAVEIELSATTPLTFEGGKLYNLHADAIQDHNDVAEPSVVRAVLYGIAAASGDGEAT